MFLEETSVFLAFSNAQSAFFEIMNVTTNYIGQGNDSQVQVVHPDFAHQLSEMVYNFEHDALLTLTG